MKNTEITYFKKSKETKKPKIISLEAGLNMIKNPSKQLSDDIAAIRKAKPEEQGALKANLPILCFCGTFKERKAAGLDKYSSVICIDLDDVKDVPGELKKIREHPSVVAAFVSPSGNGIKIVVAHDNTDETKHKELYHSIGTDMGFVGRSDLKFDTSCSDVARPCYLSADPDAYINYSAKPFHFTPSPTPYVTPKSTKSTFKSAPSSTSTIQKKWRKVIQDTHEKFEANYSMVPGQRNNNLNILAGKLRSKGVSEDVAIDYLVAYYNDPDNDFPATEIEKTVRSAYK